MRTFVMGDIHGALKALVQCLEKSRFNYEEDVLIQLGDVADGYDDVYLCVEELLKIKNCIALKGNHDEWFNEFISTGLHNGRWAQGGRGTAISYLQLTGRQNMIKRSGEGYTIPLIPSDIPATHQRFFQQQRLYYIDENSNCFVHGGFNRQLPFDQQPRYLYYWDRELWDEALSFEAFNRNNNQQLPFTMTPAFNTVFIGHTSTTHWKKDQPMEAANVCNVDTGAGHGGRLTIMEVATKKYWQSEPVTKLYKTNYR